jgi:regulator of CtrA degradation
MDILIEDVSARKPRPAHPRSEPISFIQRLAASESFKVMFREGMGLVEEAATYLDGPGREESKALHRPAALAYATESMRLTTRMMQVASWLLLRRAVNEGAMTPAQATTEKHRVRLARQEIACGAEMFAELPLRLRDLSERSLRLQARIIHLDQSIMDWSNPPTLPASVIAGQVERVRLAFAVAR